MENELYQKYIAVLEEELLPAMGCTEPIAVAYAAAVASDYLPCRPEKVEIIVSGNIIKNVKSVVVPNTNGLHGLSAAAAAGIVAGKSAKELEVISEVSSEQQGEIRSFLETTEFSVSESDSGLIFDIIIRLKSEGHSSVCRIAEHHTNIVYLEQDGNVLKNIPVAAAHVHTTEDREFMSVAGIYEFAETVELNDVRKLIARQIDYNMAISRAGMEHSYGACIGRVLMSSYGDTVQNRAKAWAAAGSDARMNGCSLPVVINSGSGNQGITCSVPVIIYARELGVSEDKLYRALVLSNLITLHLKTSIGRLSAYCGATSAGCGAGAGVCYLYGGTLDQISHTIVNAVAINSGMICDGAKSSCAAKIASAVEAGLLGMQMYLHGNQFYAGDGIISKGVEATIRNVGRVASQGMAGTDKEIIQIMISNEAPEC